MATITSRNTITDIAGRLPYQKINVTIGSNTYTHQITAVSGTTLTVQPALSAASGSCTVALPSLLPSFPMIDFYHGTGLPNPSRPLAEGLRSNDLILKFDGGNEQRRQKSQPVRLFDLNWKALSKDQYMTLRNFYFQVTTYQSFLWVHPLEKTTLTVRFSSDAFQGNNVSHSFKGPIYEVSCKLEQVL